MTSSRSGNWFLHCRKCESGIVRMSQLKLTLVGSSGIHLNIKENTEADIDNSIEQVQNPDPRKRERAPFKALCKGRAVAGEMCRTSLGAYSNGELCFSANSVYFHNRLQPDYRCKKWSEAKNKLQEMGITVQSVSPLGKDVAPSSNERRAPPLPLVFCDVTLTSNSTIDQLTRDKPRDYQRELFKNAMKSNSLVYLPTGCGKTLVAAMAIACMSHLNPRKVAVFLAPNNPLVHQQYEYLKHQLLRGRVMHLTGDSGSEPGDKTPWIELVRCLVKQRVDVVVLSPQIFINILEDEGNILHMSDVSLLVFDEAHKCQGNHPYAKIMEFYVCVPDHCKPLTLALTASPAKGLEMAKIEEELERLLGNLDCKAVVPSTKSGDLKTYWNRPVVSYLLGELNVFQKRLEMILESYLKSLNPYLTRLLGSVEQLESLPIQSSNYKGVLRNAILYSQNKQERIRGLALGEHAMGVLSILEMNSLLGCDHATSCLIKIIMAIETASNPMDAIRNSILSNHHRYQVLTAEVKHLRKLTSNNMTSSDRFQELVSELRRFAEKVRKGDDSCRGIVFVKMRKTCSKLSDELNNDPLIREYLKPQRFVGHGKGTYGMQWKEDQQPALKSFHEGDCKLLVSTNVLEEGLDVPACNLVIRFDSVMNMRALVQSRGRAARRPDSRFLIMCNNSKEKEKFQELENKEENVESAISWKAILGMGRLAADERGCEKRKLDAAKQSVVVSKIVYNENHTSSRSNKKKKRRRKPSPRVSIAVHPEIKNENTSHLSSTAARVSESRTSTSSPGMSGTTAQNSALRLTKLLEKHFVVQPSGGDLPTSSRSPVVTHYPQSTSGGITFLDLDAKPEATSYPGSHLRSPEVPCCNKNQLFDNVARVWCEKGPRGSWLERIERKTHERKEVFQILPIESFSGGDFKDRGTFCELWEHDCRQKAEIIFLHDVKMVVVAFYNSSSKLYKIEFRYDQLHEFILLDVPQSAQTSANMFLCLRHVPQLCEAFMSAFEDAPDGYRFSEYFLAAEENQEDDSEDNESHENADISQNDDLNQSLAADEGSAEEDTTNQPLAALEHLHVHDESDPEESSGESDSDVDLNETEDTESLDFFVEETRAVDAMDKVKSWSRRYAIDENISPFGEFLSLRIKVPYSLDLLNALEVLKSFGKRVFYVQVKLENQSSELQQLATFLPNDVRYAHDCLIGLHPNVRPRLSQSFYDLLTNSIRTNSINAIYEISFTLQQDYFTDPESKLRALMMTGDRARRACISQSSVPAHCSLVKRLVLTPTRVIPFPPEVMDQNRVLRHFGSERFLCVNVREEDYSKLRGQQGKLDKVLTRIKDFMDDGIEIGGQWYHFIGCSNSQMRSHGCWFVSPTLSYDANSIRQWMGDFSQIRCIASYMARLGQCFSTSLDAIGITLEEGARWEMIDDVERDGYCFSDGVGTISTRLANEVCVKVGKLGTRSALQIRFAGSKGVLCLDPSLPDDCVCIRVSMRKFESNHRRLEVLQTSRPQAVYLNHQIIMLLSNLGVPDEIFLDLQQKVLDRLAAMMLDENEALQRMSNMIRTGINYKKMADSGVSLTTEPYFKSMLYALYKEQMFRLLKKSRILLPVSESRLMMGVMDETGSLGYGQVFVQCTHMTSEGDDQLQAECQRFVVSHRVLVTRNPCLHPGDIRELEAVDVPELRHLVDCVVFPKEGPRPHPNEMAGGDLDGDLYFVSWSDSFKPRKNLFPPMKYPALKKKMKNGPITVDDMTTFFTEYIQADQLGIIDNAHKATADIEEKGIESNPCLKLAEAHSLAVDAPKTGLWPDCPHNPPENPDFMMNPTKPSYVSQKVLGKLFRECRDFEETTNYILPITGVQFETRFLVPGYRAYLESAATTYQEYASEVKTLMCLYGIKSEGEVMSGCFHKLKGDFGRERSQIAAVVRKMLSQVRTKFRTLFFNEFSREGEIITFRQITLPMQRKASAWYYHAYKAVLDPPLPSESDGKTPVQFVGFPWVVDDVLAAVLRREGHSTEVPASLNVDITRKVGQSVYELFTDEVPVLVRGYQARTELLDVVSRAINTRHCKRHLVMFGSSASLLFRPDSDLDMCVLGRPGKECETKEAQIQTLQNLEALLKNAFGKVEFIKSARVPVMRLGRLKNPGVTSSVKLPCDISADWNGFLKTTVLVEFFEYYPWLLPLIRLVLMWAHTAGLTKKVDGVRINTNVLVFMMLSFCVQAGHVSPFPVQNVLENLQIITKNVPTDLWDSIIAWIENESGREDAAGGLETSSAVGGILVEFYRKRQETLYGAIPQCFEKLLGVSTFTELLNPGDMQMLREQMQKAYHVLALHASSHALLDVSSAQIQRTFKLSSVQSLVIAGSERSYSRNLAKKSGAEVSVRPKLPGSGRAGLILEARGSIGSIRVLEGILSSEKNEYTRNKFSAMSKCFVRGATMITFEGCHSDDDYVTLVPYSGHHHQTHDQRIRHVPVLENQPSNGEESHAFQSFRIKFLDQIRVVNRDYDSIIHGELDFVIHFGRIYAFDIPIAMSEDSEPISIKDLQYSSDKGRSTRDNNILSWQQKFKKPGGSGKVKVKSDRQKKPKEKKGKKEVDKTPNHSLFTNINSGNLTDIQDYLERKGYEEQPESGEETYTATVRLGSKDFYVSYDYRLRPTAFKLPRLRWFLADVKRPWQSRGISPGTAQLDGSECDVRLMLGTSRVFTLDEIRACDNEKFMSILEPSPTPSSPYPFKIHDEMRTKLQLVRHKESAVLMRPRCGTTAFISKVTEYSRLKPTGEFKKVFHRHELVIQPKLPDSWENSNEVDRFLKRTWKLAFRLAREAS